MKAIQSLDVHRQLMAQTKYTKLPKFDGAAVKARSAFSLFFDKPQLAEVFRLDSDDRDAVKQNKVKPIHAEGISGIVQWNPHSTCRYSGIFSTGGIGIVRFSTATSYSKGGSFVPGLALKILVDDRPSVNFHAMYSLDGQGDDPFFFRNSFGTTIGPPVGFVVKQVARVFHSTLPLVSACPAGRPVNELTIPLIEAATVTSDGKNVLNVVAPKSVTFVPALRQESDWDAGEDFRESLQRFVRPGMKLYDMIDDEGSPLGELKLVEPFVASQHGDNMFFRHERVSSLKTS